MRKNDKTTFNKSNSFTLNGEKHNQLEHLDVDDFINSNNHSQDFDNHQSPSRPAKVKEEYISFVKDKMFSEYDFCANCNAISTCMPFEAPSK